MRCHFDQMITFRIFVTTEQVGDLTSFCALTATLKGVEEISNKVSPRHSTLQQAAQCSVSEALKSANIHKLNYCKFELVAKSPSYFSFLHPKDKLYGFQLDNIGALAVLKDDMSIINLNNPNLSEGLRIASECCRIVAPLSNTVDLNSTLHLLPTKQSVKRMIRAVCLEIWNREWTR